MLKESKKPLILFNVHLCKQFYVCFTTSQSSTMYDCTRKKTAPLINKLMKTVTNFTLKMASFQALLDKK